MQKGFTLIEIIIAVFILSIAVVGTYGAFSIMVTLNTNASDRLIASYLAQEGIEITRNIRDTNWLVGNSLDTFSSYLVNGDPDCQNGCEVDYKTSPYNGIYLGLWTSGTSPDPGGRFLNIDKDGFYSYQNCPTGEESCATKFKRKITVTCLPSASDCENATALKVISQVFWKEKPNILNPNLTYPSIQVEEILYDWY
jgi:prepilin-type N-terminal cleavage/methylation domain-containing protein